MIPTLYKVDIGHVDKDWIAPGTIHGQGSLGLNLQGTGITITLVIAENEIINVYTPHFQDNNYDTCNDTKH